MGCYDIVDVPCPSCGQVLKAQTKGGACLMREYSLRTAPVDVLSDVNRHAPFTCDNCGVKFDVELQITGTPRLL